MARTVQEEKICLHPEDGISTRLWIDKLKSNGTRVFYKDKTQDPPPDSMLEQDTVILYIQAEFQLDVFQRLGDGFIGIDATHNITQYENMQMFTIITWDRWGHGKF